jgi:hypothetical protein
MVRIVLFIILTLSIETAFGQADTSKVNIFEEAHFVFSGGASYQKSFSGEIGVLYASELYGPCTPVGIFGPKIATELMSINNKFIFGPKLSFEVQAFYLGGRVSLTDYTDFSKHDIRFTPEFGVTVKGLVSLFYGYSMCINNNRFEEIGHHRISLIINFDFKLKDG